MPSRRTLLVWAIIAAVSVPLLSVLDRRLATLGSVRGSSPAAWSALGGPTVGTT